MNNSAKVLLSLKRDEIIDCCFFGSIYFAKNGRIVNYKGYSPENIFFMRSLAKPLQTAIIADCDIIKDYKLTNEEIAIFSASHSGSPKHIKVIKNLAKRLKIKSSDFILKAAEPLDKRNFNGHKTLYHNNCCAKHLMMLSMCKYMGFDYKNYTSYKHPLQKLIYKKQTELTNYASKYLSKDGCGTPLWGINAKQIILAYYNLFQDKKYRIIINSILKNPEIFGGYDRLDSDIIKKSKGKLFAKVGAGGFILIYNIKNNETLLIKLTENNNPIRKLIAYSALKKLNWLDVNVKEYEYNQQKEKVAKYCYEFNF